MTEKDIPWPSQRRVTLPGRGPGEMAYLDFGPPDRPVDVVFVHANGFNAGAYRRMLTPLAPPYRVMAIDLRGHGATTLDTPLANRRDWFDLRDDILGFLHALKLRRVVLSGHSMGATSALLAAAEDADLCRRLILFDPVILPRGHRLPTEGSPLVLATERRRARFPDRAAAIASYRGRGAFKTWPDDILADYVAAGFHETPEGDVTLACSPLWEASGFAAHGHDPWDALERSACPVDIYRAETASTFHLTDSTPTSERISITTVPGATHFLPMEQPEFIRRCLTAAIEGRPQPTLRTA
jgi:pimeloyl-ACP methyl ester carboxylesterase